MERVVALPAALPSRAAFALAALRTGAAAVPTWLYLVGIVVGFATLRFTLALTAVAPWIHPDEFIYSELARSFADGAGFSVRGDAFTAWSFGPLYPIAISPAFLLTDSAPQSYLAVKALNSALWASAAVPMYSIARRLLDRHVALVASALAVAVPSGVYSAKYMTESLAYPLFLVALLAMLRALERPTIGREGAALGAIALAIGARAQMVALLAAFAGAAFATSALRTGGNPLSRRGVRSTVTAFRLTAASFGFALVALAAIALGAGRGVIGLKASVFDTVVITDAPRWFAYHVGELSLYTGVIPLIAFVIVVGSALTSRSVPTERRVFAVAALAVSTSLLALVAMYATTPKPFPRVYDRYTFYLVPLLLVALLVWVRDGLPRPRRWTLAGAAAASLLPLLLPYRGLLNGAEWGVSSSTVGLVPWGVLRNFTGTGVVLIATIAVFTGVLTYVALVAKRERRWATVRIAAYVFVALGAVAYLANAKLSENAQRFGVAADPGWIDKRVPSDARVAAIWSGFGARGWQGWYAIWENEIFNRTVADVYSLREPIPDFAREVPLRRRAGQLWVAGAPLRARYVLTDWTVRLRGDEIATDARSQMSLYRVNGIVELRRERRRG